MIYDDVLKITSLQDGNYAETSGYVAPASRNVARPNGRTNWDEANTWAANLSYGGFSDWRLPGWSIRAPLVATLLSPAPIAASKCKLSVPSVRMRICTGGIHNAGATSALPPTRCTSKCARKIRFWTGTKC